MHSLADAVNYDLNMVKELTNAHHAFRMRQNPESVCLTCKEVMQMVNARVCKNRAGIRESESGDRCHQQRQIDRLTKQIQALVRAAHDHYAFG